MCKLSSVKSKEGKKEVKYVLLNVKLLFLLLICVCSKCIHIYKIAIIMQKIVVKKENVSGKLMRSGFLWIYVLCVSSPLF